MNRQIVLDTETTGLSHQSGHRIIEIGCVELIDRVLTGKHFHVYINPEREVDEGAFRVHGISTEFLKDKPVFSAIAEDLLTFIDGTELIIHNAAFDMGFLDAELKRYRADLAIHNHVTVFDTLVFAREKHKGARNNLDALCKRYRIDNTHRTLHGALMDAEILAHVYLAMTGGQIELFAASVEEESMEKNDVMPMLSNASTVLRANEEELQAHASFIQYIIETSKINRWSE